MYKVEPYVEENVPKIFKKSKSDLERDVRIVRAWLKSQNDLPEVMSEKMISNFIIFNKFQVDKAKQRILNYYKYRTYYPEFYENLLPKSPEMSRIKDIWSLVILPKLTDEMYRVSICAIKDYSRVDEIEPLPTIVHFLQAIEMRLNEDYTYDNILILDLTGSTYSLALKFTPTMLYKLIQIMEKVYSMRINRIYFVNAPAVVPYILAVLKKILRPKIFERICVCQEISELLVTLPKRIMPREYGGDEVSMQELHDVFWEQYNNYQWRYEQIEKFKYTPPEDEERKNCILS